jgi:hypothetical protein
LPKVRSNCPWGSTSCSPSRTMGSGSGSMITGS